jgi:hypothetical protein
LLLPHTPNLVADGKREQVAADCRSDPNSKKLPKLLVPMQTWTAELDIGDHADFSSRSLFDFFILFRILAP